MSRLIFNADTLGGTTTISSEDTVDSFVISLPAKTGTLLVPATVGIAGQALVSNGTNAPAWQTLAGTGTVTSVNVSGGTTGLTTSGGPVTGAGTITLTGTLIAANGGTGQSLYAVGDILYASTTTALSKLSVGSNGQVLTLAAGVPTWSTGSSGTVTSINGSGGTTGLTLTGGPITSFGTLTLGGTLAVANGGTGLTSPGASGNVLTSNGTSWISSSAGSSGISAGKSIAFSIIFGL